MGWKLKSDMLSWCFFSLVFSTTARGLLYIHHMIYSALQLLCCFALAASTSFQDLPMRTKHFIDSGMNYKFLYMYYVKRGSPVHSSYARSLEKGQTTRDYRSNVCYTNVLYNINIFWVKLGAFFYFVSGSIIYCKIHNIQLF